MTEDEQKAMQEDNKHFMDYDESHQAKDALWVLGVTIICGFILISIFILEMMEL